MKPAKTKHVLLVEDSPDDQELARAALEQSGHDCRLSIVSDGAEAVAVVKELCIGNVPDLVLLDVKLPKLTGIEVLQQWRADERLRYTPVVMLSTSHQPGDIRRAYGAGANGYIVKPVDFETFIATLSRVCHYWLKLNQPVEDIRSLVSRGSQRLPA